MEGYLVKLLYRRLQPPVGTHEGQSNGNFSVHGAESPVLPEKKDWRLCERDSNRHQDNNFEKNSEEKRNNTDKQENGHAGLRPLKMKNQSVNLRSLNFFRVRHAIRDLSISFLNSNSNSLSLLTRTVHSLNF